MGCGGPRAINPRGSGGLVPQSAGHNNWWIYVANFDEDLDDYVPPSKEK